MAGVITIDPYDDLRKLRELYDALWLSEADYKRIKYAMLDQCFGPGSHYYHLMAAMGSVNVAIPAAAHAASRPTTSSDVSYNHRKKGPRGPQRCSVCHEPRRQHTCSGEACPSADVCGYPRLHSATKMSRRSSSKKKKSRAAHAPAAAAPSFNIVADGVAPRALGAKGRRGAHDGTRAAAVAAAVVPHSPPRPQKRHKALTPRTPRTSRALKATVLALPRSPETPEPRAAPLRRVPSSVTRSAAAAVDDEYEEYDEYDEYDDDPAEVARLLAKQQEIATRLQYFCSAVRTPCPCLHNGESATIIAGEVADNSLVFRLNTGDTADAFAVSLFGSSQIVNANTALIAEYTAWVISLRA